MSELFWKRNTISPIQRELKKLSAETWLDYLLGERSIPEKFIPIIPRMPSETVQLHFTGASGRTTLLQSLDFYEIAKENIISHGIKLDDSKKLLDFGCGWGRIVRMWIKDIPGRHIYGVDPMADIINICKETIPQVNFHRIDPAPPISIFNDTMFDLLTAYSVFSHLNETYLNNWFNEFSRLLKKGGLLFITTRSRYFINHLQLLRDKNDYDDYAVGLRDCFTDLDTAFSEYDKGNVVHQPIGGGSLSNTFYGETCVPEAYFHRFENHFDILKFIPQLKYETNQALAILRRK